MQILVMLQTFWLHYSLVCSNCSTCKWRTAYWRMRSTVLRRRPSSWAHTQCRPSTGTTTRKPRSRGSWPATVFFRPGQRSSPFDPDHANILPGFLDILNFVLSYGHWLLFQMLLIFLNVSILHALLRSYLIRCCDYYRTISGILETA